MLVLILSLVYVFCIRSIVATTQQTSFILKEVKTSFQVQLKHVFDLSHLENAKVSFNELPKGRLQRLDISTAQLASFGQEYIPIMRYRNEVSLQEQIHTKIPAYDDFDTVLAMAMMSSNAYVDHAIPPVPGAPVPNENEKYLKKEEPPTTATETSTSTPEPTPPDSWYDIPEYRVRYSIGLSGPSLRGYIFLSEDESTLILSYKGTSASFLGVGAGPTSTRDRREDNLMFSCCCARVDFTWSPVCGCYSGRQTCQQQCLEEAVQDPTSYLDSAKAIYEQVRELYPTTNIWFTGHSLGGALASLMTLSVNKENKNLPSSAITFASPGERLYAQRRHLLPPMDKRQSQTDTHPIWHYGVSADPIFHGACTGTGSSCYYGGYALETGCHVGHRCVWALDGRFDVRKHRIQFLIDEIIRKIPLLPQCFPESDQACNDCSQWSFE